jgi:hypothetical protein
MAQAVQIAAPVGIGGVIQGNFGTYPQASDGSYTVDPRDAVTLLGQGFGYVKQATRSYTLPLAPGAATVGQIVASGALSNGSVSVTHQPDTMRPVNVEVGTGTTAITAGTVAVTYIGNDGVSGTDTLSLVCALSTSTTQGLSRGVQTISAITVAGVVGGTSPWFRMSTTAAVSVPVDPGTIDFSVTREYDAGATIAVGTLAVALGSITPTTAPNATVTYAFNYEFVAPNS